MISFASSISFLGLLSTRSSVYRSPLILCFTFLLLPSKPISTDQRFLACREPKTCGDGQTIGFPFYINNTQPPFCGVPGFMLSCDKDNKTLLKSEDDDSFYVVLNISYSNQTLRLSNAAFWKASADDNYGVVERLKNMSLPDDRFRLNKNRSKRVLLFYGCDWRSFGEYRMRGCDIDSGNSTVAMCERRFTSNGVGGRCRGMVMTAVEVGSEEMGMKRRLREGFWVKWLASDCGVCERSGRCGFNQTTYHFECFCPDRPHAKWCARPGSEVEWKKIGLGLGIGAPVFLLMILATIFICYQYQRRHRPDIPRRDISSDPYSKSDIDGATVFIRVPIFSYKELEVATDKFSDDNLLGDGGFGNVYYGKLQDGREVAVKCLYDHNSKRLQQFMNEIEILAYLRHENLVSLYGSTSYRSHELLLVYEFISNGTLADHLHGDKAKAGLLTWPVRLGIAIETASALTYLHASDIIHRDVKSSNILLDKNFSVKVADFGLSRLLPKDVTHVSTAPQGTPGYVDPEYHQYYHLTGKSDVYSFGVVLVELISSMPAVDIFREKMEINLANLAINKIKQQAYSELIDSCLGYEKDVKVKHMTTWVADLAYRCLQQDPEMRPKMNEVLQELKKIQSGDERNYQNDVTNKANSPTSLTDYSETALLKTIKPSPPPLSVTEKWDSGLAASSG